MSCGGGHRSIFCYFSRQPSLLLLFGNGKEERIEVEIEVEIEIERFLLSSK